ncbi:MAG TPA: putative Ig domain-containing protein [Steroidobacteraceae bacterium]
MSGCGGGDDSAAPAVEAATAPAPAVTPTSTPTQTPAADSTSPSATPDPVATQDTAPTPAPVLPQAPAPVAPTPTPSPVPVPVPAPTPAPTAQNQAPTISGSALTAVNANNAYNFVPNATDADDDTLAFSIQQKPSWATFSTVTGKLSGTPSAADVGTYSNIVIGVTDGKASSTMGPFSIQVTATSDGRVTLSWSPPTENTDGTPITDLSGYKIRYGTSPSALTQTLSIDNSGVTSYVLENLSPATWYFAVVAVTSSGSESSDSNVVNKKI